MRSSDRSSRTWGIISVLLGNFLALIYLMSSNLWLWELNETWQVKTIVPMISTVTSSKVFIDSSETRPSLNWYSRQQIRSVSEFADEGFILTNDPKQLEIQPPLKDCLLTNEIDQWKLMFCTKK